MRTRAAERAATATSTRGALPGVDARVGHAVDRTGIAFKDGRFRMALLTPALRPHPLRGPVGHRVRALL
uniref:Uncharacterized protein n=1 Tax=Ralstonia solanacearum TaxID=305 RepID=A0A0S4TLV0_RALSL|nr:protein of unknown function [Ralstonia solanacearum]